MSGNVTAEPVVTVIMAALNETGKIGRVMDKWPDDPRFESVVIDDGSTDGTGDEARAHGAAVVLRHEQRGGVGAAIRTGLEYAQEHGRLYVAFLAGDDQHEPSDLVGAFDFLLARKLEYVQGSRWMRGSHIIGPIGGRGLGTRIYSVIFSLLVFRRVTDATNGFRIFRTSILDDRSINIEQAWLSSYELEPYLLYRVIRGGYPFAEFPVTVRYHADGYTKMRGIRDWWRLLRPALLLRLGIKH